MATSKRAGNMAFPTSLHETLEPTPDPGAQDPVRKEMPVATCQRVGHHGIRNCWVKS